MKLTLQDIENNIKQLSIYLTSLEVDALYLSGSDYYLSEYSAKEVSLRSYLTPFTGSTAEVLIIPNKKVLLFVDGRYHFQADLECKELAIMEVMKVSSPVSLFNELTHYLVENHITKLAIVPERTQFSKLEKLTSHNLQLISVATEKVEQLIGLQYSMKKSPIYPVPENILPSLYENKFKALNLPVKQAIFLSSCDDIAWLSHCRSFQTLGNSYFLSKALVTSDHLHIFVPLDTEISEQALHLNEVTFYPVTLSTLEEKVHHILEENGITKVIYDAQTITASDYQLLNNKFDHEDLLKKSYPVTQLRIYKSHEEIKECERIFLLSSHAIAETIRIAKKAVKNNQKFSEKDLAETVWSEYQKRGAKALSFNTIAGVGENSAIIHYGACSPDKKLAAGVMTLLDSGAYYESGYATDCTRCFIPEFQTLGQDLQNYYKKVYTLVLKAQLQAEMSVFKPGTLGNTIDQVARGEMLRHGMDFSHGLGHGVGVLVHDPGAGRLSPSSREELHAGVVCSIEPGYYLDNQYGVRLENVVYVRHHPDYTQYCKFQPLIFVGWEEELIQKDLLSPDESSYLTWYQNQCRTLGTLT